MHYTTLNKIREHHPCAEGWKTLLDHLGKTEADDEPLSLSVILESNGIDDAIWSLRCIDADKLIRKFACDCAEGALKFHEAKYPDDKRPRECIQAARDYIDGKIDIGELRSNSRAAADAYADAYADAAAADADADAAAYAAAAAAAAAYADAAAADADAAAAYAAAAAAAAAYAAAAAAAAYAAADAAYAAAAADADAADARKKQREEQAEMFKQCFCS